MSSPSDVPSVEPLTAEQMRVWDGTTGSLLPKERIIATIDALTDRANAAEAKVTELTADVTGLQGLFRNATLTRAIRAERERDEVTVVHRTCDITRRYQDSVALEQIERIVELKEQIRFRDDLLRKSGEKCGRAEQGLAGCQDANEVLIRENRRLREQDTPIPRWEDDRLAIEQGWVTPERCGRCGEKHEGFVALQQKVEERDKWKNNAEIGIARINELATLLKKAEDQRDALYMNLWPDDDPPPSNMAALQQKVERLEGALRRIEDFDQPTSIDGGDGFRAASIAKAALSPSEDTK